jgi:hypothetical protein
MRAWYLACAYCRRSRFKDFHSLNTHIGMVHEGEELARPVGYLPVYSRKLVSQDSLDLYLRPKKKARGVAS